LSSQGDAGNDHKEDGAEDEIPSHQDYPDTVEFEGTVYTSLKQVHISGFLIALVGVIVAYSDPLLGFPVLIVFLLIVLAVEAWMIRKSRKQLRLTLHLLTDPVEATQGTYKVGVIEHGTIDTDMDAPNELGYRPAPKRSLITWTFDSVEDKEYAAKRLLEYLPRDDLPQESV
jgi:hypothetical protein